MAGGMLTKQAVMLTAKFLNDVNDSVSGGIVTGLPAGAPTPPSSQTLPGDRIVLDDATALALSDTTVGTLFGGIYMYVGTLSTATQAPAVGGAAFWRAADLGGGATQAYQVTSDPQPTAAIPAFLAGVFINVATKGNFCWVQVAGVCTVLYDAATTAQVVGNPVSYKIGSTVGTFDSGVVVTTATIAHSYAGAFLGSAVDLPVNGALKRAIMQRNPFGGRI
jgi:hypothetical protein